jgi:hypothetical protein
MAGFWETSGEVAENRLFGGLALLLVRPTGYLRLERLRGES